MQQHRAIQFSVSQAVSRRDRERQEIRRNTPAIRRNTQAKTPQAKTLAPTRKRCVRKNWSYVTIEWLCATTYYQISSVFQSAFYAKLLYNVLYFC